MFVIGCLAVDLHNLAERSFSSSNFNGRAFYSMSHGGAENASMEIVSTRGTEGVENASTEKASTDCKGGNRKYGKGKYRPQLWKSQVWKTQVQVKRLENVGTARTANANLVYNTCRRISSLVPGCLVLHCMCQVEVRNIL